MKIIDTHIHLDLKQFNHNLNDILDRARKSGITKFIIPCIETHKVAKILSLCENNKDIYFAAGTHPNYIESFNKVELENLIKHEKCISVGECGLDWFRIPTGADIKEVKFNQIRIFREQIELAIKYNKPLILHSRDTDEEMLSTLLYYKDSLPGGVIHCYVGSEKLLELEKYGFYFGIGGILTYSSAVDLRENVKKIPLNKIVLETDGPYLTPSQAKNRTKINEPSFIPYIIKDLSKILSIEENNLADICFNNTNKLFKF